MRTCTPPPLGYVPGPTPRSSIRAPAAAIAMRPTGLTSTSQPAPIAHHDTAGAHSWSTAASAVVRVSVHTSQRRPTTVLSTTPRSSWAPWVGRGVLVTHSRSSAISTSLRASMRSAIAPRRGNSYTSATVACGCSSRSADTSWAADRLLPPSSKKSSSMLSTRAPRTSCQRSASEAAGPCSTASDSSSRPGSGHGSAARSTFPEIRTGISSQVVSRGTSAAGSVARSDAVAPARSMASPAR